MALQIDRGELTNRVGLGYVCFYLDDDYMPLYPHTPSVPLYPYTRESK